MSHISDPYQRQLSAPGRAQAAPKASTPVTPMLSRVGMAQNANFALLKRHEHDDQFMARIDQAESSAADRGFGSLDDDDPYCAVHAKQPK